ncbi:MAG TPA: hypothetical protein VMY34_02760 [Acidimicrobiales bacterium]|nr:hypothetical protein [Acidimicrobiales bacterium]
MSGQGHVNPRTMRGTIRSRLLVNALVDPDEAAHRLPNGLRPHVTSQGTVVGCCLLDIVAIRPAPLPAIVGTSLRAAAHRISVEWDDDSGATTVGVYVPLRLTHSRTAIAFGGRVFPGVHRRASVKLTHDGQRLGWSVDAGGEPGAYSVRVDASSRDGAPLGPCEPIGGTCLSAEIGLSPGHDGVLEAARMRPHHRIAHPVDVHHLESAFLASFTSAMPAPSYLMRDVEVTWTRARVPRLQPVEVLL